MAETIENVVAGVGQQYRDKRFHIFDLRAEKQPGGVVALTGRVLDPQALDDVRRAVQGNFPEVEVDASAVQVLRQAEPAQLTVATNMTSLLAQPDWISEQENQLLAGQRLELLEQRDRWGFVRQVEDGYLGWAYLPYLTTAEPLPPTHIVLVPMGLLRSEPDGPLVGRLWGGTPVCAVDRRDGWVRVSVFLEDNPALPVRCPAGWMPEAYLRALDEMPFGEAARRQMMMDAANMIGVPYLWGGVTSGGIDCSGFAQLLYRWIGMSIPRDADVQSEAGWDATEPFQPGDLLFFGEEENGKMRVTHVTISTGGWNVIHSTRRCNGVVMEDVKATPALRDHFMMARAFL